MTLKPLGVSSVSGGLDTIHAGQSAPLQTRQHTKRQSSAELGEDRSGRVVADEIEGLARECTDPSIRARLLDRAARLRLVARTGTADPRPINLIVIPPSSLPAIAVPP